MSNQSKFTVIKSSEEEKNKEMKRIDRIEKINQCWERQFFDTIMKHTKEYGTLYELPQEVLMKIGFSGIKYICSCRDVARENRRLGIDETKTFLKEQARFQLIDKIFDILGCLTLRNFVIMFPIEKDYDGEKWECKDYFYTMDVLSKMDWDKPIGRDELIELLWDYQNDDLRHAYIEFTTAMSAIYRLQTGKSIGEEWCEKMGIPTYTIDNETGMIQDNKSGNITKMKKGSHLQIVK